MSDRVEKKATGARAWTGSRYKPAFFFLAAFIATWIPWFIATYLGSQGVSEAYPLLLNFVGLLGPAAVAMFLVLSSGDAALKTDFKDRIVNFRRIRPIYLIAAIAIPSAVMVLSIWLSLWLGQSVDQFALAGSGAALLPMIILTMVLAPIIEETGWHGYGVDSLRAYSGMLTTTLLFGVLWSVWHAPLTLIIGSYPNQLASMENPIFLIKFLRQRHPGSHYRQLALLQTQAVDRGGHPVSYFPERWGGAPQCRTGRQMHRHSSIRDHRCGHSRH